MYVLEHYKLDYNKGFDKSSAKQSGTWDNATKHKADVVLAGGDKINYFNITDWGVGKWWEVNTKSYAYVHSVRIRNRYTNAIALGADRLGDTEVYVDQTLCGKVQSNTVQNTWYHVKFDKPVYG